ncbi:MAG: aminopeptidase [Pirellulales bacterium]|nr:aminopeptidase [Pirellulales bacterium]
MPDPRIKKLADLLLDHSCLLKKGERVLVEAFDLPETDLVTTLVEGISHRGGVALVSWKSNQVLRSLYQTATEESMQLAARFEAERMQAVDAYIGIRGAANASQFADVPHDQMDLFQQHWWNPVHGSIRVPETRWVVLRYPTDSFAQAADMSTAAFKDFYFDVCTADYAAMGRAQEPLVARMKAADRVKIVAPGTEIEFSIKDIPVIPCNGERNIPDGEVFTAPVRDSINGVIHFNTTSRYQGTVFSNIEFEFQDGKVVRASANETEKLEAILDSDEGARYGGEWSMGTNNHVRHPMLDTLFDEKIGGSFHFALGKAYDVADNHNRSRIHWDLVLIQREDYGGGEIWFDGQLLRKNGHFVPADLQGLNQGL